MSNYEKPTESFINSTQFFSGQTANMVWNASDGVNDYEIPVLIIRNFNTVKMIIPSGNYGPIGLSLVVTEPDSYLPEYLRPEKDVHIPYLSTYDVTVAAEIGDIVIGTTGVIHFNYKFAVFQVGHFIIHSDTVIEYKISKNIEV